MSNLKPCPFCGGEAALGTTTMQRWKDSDGNYGTFTGHSVNCIMCGATNRGIAEGFKTPEDAAHQWNRRSEAEQGFEKIGALHRPRNGGVHFLQDVFSIPLAVHGTLDVYMKKASRTETVDE